MDLSRVAGKFCSTPVYGLDPTTQEWVGLGINGSVQTYDRFITERTFGQKKRVLVTLRDSLIPENISQIRVGDDLEVYLVESLVPDLSEVVYEVIYSLRQAKYAAVLCQLQGAQRLSGVSSASQEVELENLWIDLERFGGEPSRQIDAVDYDIYTAVLPRHSQAKVGQYLKVGTQRYRVDAVYPLLDLPTAKVVRYE
jgi:hypothetical protein